MKKVSVIIPTYNESEGITAFHNDLLMPELVKLNIGYEIIYVNDGSSDDTLRKLSALAKKNKHVTVLALSRNFGKEMATTAGIAHANGDALILIDADGQHPPSCIAQFIKKWQNGAQVVVGVRKSNQKEGLVKKTGSMLFYKIFNSTSQHGMVPRSTDFRLIDKVVRDEFVQLNERNRITRGLIDWLGFKREYVSFDSPARIAGEATYKTSQLVRLAINSLTSLSLKPLFVFGWVGIIITILSSLFGTFIILEQFILSDPLLLDFSGAVILGVFISFLVGLVLISQAMLAVYISHIHAQTQGRPLYIIDPTTSINLTS